MRVLSAIYAEAAHRRRRWYAAHPEVRRRLARPVISVGNLTVGGSGKTPLVRHLAQLLVRNGERPSVLSRGYRRVAAGEGVVVVGDGERVAADVRTAGDEPVMLARTLSGTAVLVSADRYLAGRLAETRLGCTVHILDDGFQHVRLDRDLDILVVTGEEVEQRVIPAGRLRERVAEAARADAIVLAHPTADPGLTARRLGVSTAFRMVSALGTARLVGDEDRTVPLEPGTRVLVVAAVARPQRFVADLRAAGLDVAGTLLFRDHHPFSHRDLDEIHRQATSRGAQLILTTEKDETRLRPLLREPISLAWVPQLVHVEPAAAFESWITEELARARATRREPLHRSEAPAI